MVMCLCVVCGLLRDAVCGVCVIVCMVHVFKLFVRVVCGLLRWCTVCDSFACFVVCLCLCVFGCCYVLVCIVWY